VKIFYCGKCLYLHLQHGKIIETIYYIQWVSCKLK